MILPFVEDEPTAFYDDTEFIASVDIRLLSAIIKVLLSS